MLVTTAVLLFLLGLTDATRLPIRRTSTTPIYKLPCNSTELYACHVCDSTVSDLTLSPQTRWRNAYADAAWSVATYHWTTVDRPAGTVKFGESLGVYFANIDGYNCQTTQGGECGEAIGCKSTFYDAGYVD